MKKIFVAMLALAAATACSNVETVSLNQEAIGFDNAFINNSVRSVETPGYSKSNMFNDFAVYGFVEGASLFNGVKVAKTGVDNTELKSAWKYAGTQYWIAGANYDFYAVAPYTGGWSVKTDTTPSEDGATLSFTTTDGTQDLLYAPIVARQGANNDYSAVAFTFQHILSKVKFSFKNGYNASAATICVRDIKITNANESGEVALTDVATWSNQSGPKAIAFGNATTEGTYATDATEANFVNYDYAYDTTVESYYERLLIPGAVTGGYNVTFTVDLLVSGTVVKTYNHTATVDFTPVAGHSYDINAEITAANIDPNHAQEPIEFTATMTDWSAAEDKNATINNNTANN